jgi:hypothetical protein
VTLGLVAAPSASAAVRHASPESTDVSGQCSSSPCRLDRAVAVAGPADEVVLAGGTYAVGYAIRSTAAVSIRPAVAAQRPRLVGSPGLGSPTLELAGGGTVTGLDIESTSNVALQLGGGARGVALILKAGPTATAAAKLFSAPNPTALIGSVARNEGANTAIDMIDPASGPGGGAALINVTAISSQGNSWGVVTSLADQNPVLTNVIARGTSKDLHGRSGSKPIAVTSSNFRSARAANFTDVAGNQKDVPVAFVDEAAGDLRLASGAAAIDAGVEDPLAAGTSDPAGAPRSIGARPDIGAYEHDPASPPVARPPVGDDDDGEDGAPDDDPSDPGATDQDTKQGGVTPTPGSTAEPFGVLPLALPAAGTPALAETVAVDVDSGTLLVRAPGARTFVPLTAATVVGVGSTIDARAGRVRLTSVREGGRLQTGEFWGGIFTVRQTRSAVPYTELVLTGGDFRGCPTARTRAARRRSPPAAPSTGASAGPSCARCGAATTRAASALADATATRRSEAPSGSSRTAATARARWSSTARVLVKPTRRGRTVLVKAGSSHLVRAPARYRMVWLVCVGDVGERSELGGIRWRG